FFFSSRRRHTRFDCDWSSDVCSSDLDCSHVIALPGLWGQKNVAAKTQAQGRTTVRLLSLPTQRLTRNYRFIQPIRAAVATVSVRSEERRVGKECRSWWWTE